MICKRFGLRHGGVKKDSRARDISPRSWCERSFAIDVKIARRRNLECGLRRDIVQVGVGKMVVCLLSLQTRARRRLHARWLDHWNWLTERQAQQEHQLQTKFLCFLLSAKSTNTRALLIVYVVRTATGRTIERIYGGSSRNSKASRHFTASYLRQIGWVCLDRDRGTWAYF